MCKSNDTQMEYGHLAEKNPIKMTNDQWRLLGPILSFYDRDM